MDFTSHFQPLAHAYLIEGNRSAIERELLSILKNEHSIEQLANPDFWLQQFGTFTIENSREVKEFASQRKLGEGKRVFVISADSMTREAGNALLKTLEEPGEDNHFFIIMPSIARALPTILSRVRVVKHVSEVVAGPMSPKDFFTFSPGERIKKIKEVFAELEKETISKADIAAFIEDSLHYLHDKKKEVSFRREAAAVFYSRDQSASLKMILEYLALVG